MKRPTPDQTAVLTEPRRSALAADVPAWRDYLMLTKPEISFLVTISALAGFLLGSPDGLDGWLLFFALVGTLLTSCGVSVLNHLFEADLDASMRRTMNRPLPAGRISPQAAKVFGLALAGAGIGILCPLVNPLTAVLAIATGVLYLYVYTPLKRTTKYNTLIGTIPGALPALGGWTAATNTLGLGGWTIFGILLVWQMPHFLSLAWMYRKDYDRGGYRMLPVVEPDGVSTVRQTLGFTVALLLISLTPTLVGVMSWFYAAGAALLGLAFLRPAVAFYRTQAVQDARRVLKASIWYVPALVLLIVADRLLF